MRQDLNYVPSADKERLITVQMTVPFFGTEEQALAATEKMKKELTLQGFAPSQFEVVVTG